MLFMDFMCDPKNAARNVNWNGYPMPNRGQDQTFADLAKDDPNIVVTIDDLEGGDQFANLPQEDRELWTDTFLEVKAVVSENRFAHLMLAPAAVWLVLLFAVPLGIVIAVSLGSTDPLYQAVYGWHPANFADVFDPLFAPVLLRSVGYALATVALCLLIGYPIAYYIARFGGRWKTLLIAVVVLPFLVNYLVRTYAWVAILSDEGLLNGILQDIGHDRHRGPVREHVVGRDRRSGLRLPRVHDPAAVRGARPHGPLL